MKRFKFYLTLLLLLGLATGCNDNFDTPPIVVPTASHKPNMTIADFKAKYWQNTVNYIDTVKEDIVIHGWVSSSDASGNIYKSMYIQDETGGLTISINSSGLSSTFRPGQEIVIVMKDRYIGKYNGQQQLGFPQFYEKNSVWEATFLPLEMWETMVEPNGLPDPDKVQPVDVKISDFQGKTDAETLLKYEGQLVRIRNVKFEDADGTVTYAEADATTNRNIVDSEGNTLVMRNSNYASFRADPLPRGEGTIIGLLSYYATSDTRTGTWQLYIRDTNDCIGFTTDTRGLIADPFKVEDVLNADNEGRNGWVKGYIVGAVAPEVTTVSGSGDIEFKYPTTLDNTIVLADSPDCTDASKCVLVELPMGTPMRKQLNLADDTNADLYKSVVYIKGTLGAKMGMKAITENSGATDEFKSTVVTGGVTELSEGFNTGLPADWSNVALGSQKLWYQTTFDNNGYAAMTGYKGTPPFDTWLITPAIDIKKAPNKIFSFRTQVNGYGSKTTVFEVYLLSSNDPATAERIKLNPTIATAPASGYSSWANSGNIDLSKYAGTYFIGFRYAATSDANYATWCVDDVKFGEAGGGDEPDPEPTPTSSTRADLETLNGGEAKSTYGTYSSTLGWKLTNGNVLVGGDTDSNPVFKFIGYVTGSTSQYAMAACINGKTSSVGTLVSPTIKGGCAKLRFSYGAPYTDTAMSFRVDIKQGGTVVKTFTITEATVTKYEKLDKELTVGITGDFTIEFTNLSPSALDSNKDRVALWNINWDPKS